MGLLYLKQGGNTDLDLTTDGNTDTYQMQSVTGVDLQLVRSLVDNVGQPLITFEISNDDINWDSWEVEGFIFKDLNSMFLFAHKKNTFFRMSWLSNSSTGTFTANFNIV